MFELSKDLFTSDEAREIVGQAVNEAGKQLHRESLAKGVELFGHVLSKSLKFEGTSPELIPSLEKFRAELPNLSAQFAKIVRERVPENA